MAPSHFKLELPLYTGGKTRMLKSGSMTKPTKKQWLTMNQYRNWHYQTASDTKVLFKAAITPAVMCLPNLTELWGQIHLHYTMYPPSRQKRDLMNYVSVIDKYFSDTLVELGKLDDDDLEGIKSLSCLVGEVDKKNPRMDVIITQHLFSN